MEAASAFSDKIKVAYGGTEFGMISFPDVDDPNKYNDFDCGTPTLGVEIKIVNTEHEGTIMPTGERGLILVKHVDSRVQLLNEPDATKALYTSDGFFRTGDIGKLTADGHLIVEGRGSDAISRGMYIFYPGWLETRIRRCPGVVDVAVVGVPDPVVGEELCACLLLESDDITVQSVQEFVEKDIVTSIDDPLSKNKTSRDISSWYV
ncbi:putative peroxisomal-coenzyme A synthetase [Pomacea canaliculata]|uniref:putative peroxisomal-coenzyme A synthetase n=1 Tax=Pomacea canaliculata TaxID=400727 RepID=UPI000D72D933|nr:putative peroxisomal-coenzyme A synthetase [Pomacea canaliculata]